MGNTLPPKELGDQVKPFSQCASRSLALLISSVLLLSCGGGGGSTDTVIIAPGSTSVCKDEKGLARTGVFSGFTGNFNWPDAADSNGGGGGGGGAGASSGDGGGGTGAGGALGQFRKALVVVNLPDGTELGRALTGETDGMVTICAGDGYAGSLSVEIQGQQDAVFFEEGKNVTVPFPPGSLVRALVPKITKNIGITPFTEAAYQLALSCVAGTSPSVVCSAGAAVNTAPAEKSVQRSLKATAAPLPSVAAITAANTRVLDILNQQFQSSLQVDDLIRLPFIVGDKTSKGDLTLTQRGKYGLINIAFSKQAAMFNTNEQAPTLLATEQLSKDLLDGNLDGLRSGNAIASADKRTYDPATITTELNSALAQQTTRYGNSAAVAVLPSLVAYASVRYDSYYFDARVVPNGTASTIAVATESGIPSQSGISRTPGEETPYVVPQADQRAFMVYGNMGSGSLFIKTDSNDSTSTIQAVGDNSNGELGTGDRKGSSGLAPKIVLPGILTHVAGGMAHTVARFADGTIYAWGDNSYAQLGQGFITGLDRSLAPLKVPLPLGATSVAASNVASHALLEDGRVFSWGSSWDFGTLGDGSDSGQRLSPAPVVTAQGVLTGVVQIAARDNDALAVTADGSIYTWGSFPNTKVLTGDVSNTVGGLTLATKMQGLPANVAPRKVLTEQGLYAALYVDGSVYAWGVHFDITAQGVLYDTQPQRVLNLPPLRDILPGGFIGYGSRPFDRNTAIGVDYDGKFWKIRGRVAERFDPSLPTRQRRPLHVQAFTDADRADPLLCASCHTVLGKTLPPSPPKTGTACGPIPTHIQDLLTSESVCESCHNGTPLLGRNNRILPLLNCVPPALPTPPTRSEATGFSTQCQLPPTNHVTISSGTFCASCHNSVIQKPLNCVVTPATTARALSTSAIISSITDNATGSLISVGGISPSTSPRLSGTISASLANSESVEVLRNGVRVGNSNVTGQSWVFIDSTPVSNSYIYTSRVISLSAIGPMSPPYLIQVENGVPGQIATIASVTDDTGTITGNVANGGSTDDATPRLSGSLSQVLKTGQSLQILRNGSPVGSASVSSQAWAFTDTLGSPGLVSYTARVLSSSSIPGSSSASYSINYVGSTAPSSIISSALDDVGSVTGSLSSGSVTDDNTPLLIGTISSPINAQSRVRIIRNGAEIGRAAISGTNWTFQEASLADGAYVYQAEVLTDVGTFGLISPSFNLTIAAAGPAQSASISLVGGTSANGTISTTTPAVQGNISATLPSGSRIEIFRNSSLIGSATLSGTTWSFNDGGLTNGQIYDYSARIVSVAGVAGATSAAFRVSVNTGSGPSVGINSVGGAGNGGVISVSNPTVVGTLSVTLTAGESVRVFRNSVQIGSASLSGTSWSFADSGLVGGQTYVYKAQIFSSSGVAQNSTGNFSVSMVTAGSQAIAITSVGGQTTNGGTTTALSPTVLGTLSSAPQSGESIRVFRRSGSGSESQIGTLSSVSGTSWSFSDAPLANGAYTYRSQIFTSAGTPGSQASFTVTINYSETRSGSITSIAGKTVSGSFSNVINPLVLGTRPTGATVQVCRSPSLACRTITDPTNTLNTWSYSETTSLVSGTAYTYSVQVIAAGGQVGPTSNFIINIDTVAPLASGITLSLLPNFITYPYSGNPWHPANSDTSRIADARPALRLSSYSGDALSYVRISRSTLRKQDAGYSSANDICETFPGGTCAETVAQPLNGRGYYAFLADLAGNESTAISSFGVRDFPLCASWWPTSGTIHSADLTCATCHSIGNSQTAGVNRAVLVPPSSGISGRPQYYCEKPAATP